MNRRETSGYITLLTMLIIGAVVTVVAVTLLTVSANAQRTMLVEQQAGQAHGLVVACVEEALQQMYDNISYVSQNTFALGQGSCSYNIVDNGNNGSTRNREYYRTINATGTVGGVDKKLQVYVTISTSSISITSWQEVS